jgi:hypothetical protein
VRNFADPVDGKPGINGGGSNLAVLPTSALK